MFDPKRKLTPGDINTVANLRRRHGEAVAKYDDLHIADTWRHFSQSEDYPNEDKFLEWLAD